MFTSATASERSALPRFLLTDLAVSLFCALFGAVYELFSHGVYAYPMLYAFAFPLALGVLPLALILLLRAPQPSRFVYRVSHAGIAALTVGSLVSGALEIYGTTNPLTAVYWIVGSALTLLGAVIYLISLTRRKR